MARYNHMYTIAYELETSDPKGYSTTDIQHTLALLRRIIGILDRTEAAGFTEAVGGPDDTYEVEAEKVSG